MSDIRKSVLLYRTNTKDAVPSANDLLNGEVAMNNNSESPFLMFKDTNNEIVKIGTLTNSSGSSEYNTMTQKAITDYVESKSVLSNSYVMTEYPEDTGDKSFDKINSGDTIEGAIKTLDENMSTIIKAVLENEVVESAAISKIKESVGLNENLAYVTENNANIIKNASSLHDADNIIASNVELLNSKYEQLDTKLSNITTDIKVNDVSSTVVNGVSVVTIDGGDVKLSSDYSSVEYPETLTEEFSAVTKEMTIEGAIKQLDSTSVQIVNSILDIEDVAAAAITQIKESVGLDENLKYIADENSTIINGATSFAEADTLLSNKIVYLEESMIKNASQLDLSSEYSSVEYPETITEEFSAVTKDLNVEEAIKQLDSTSVQIVNSVLENEKTVAASFTMIKEQVGLDENLKYVKDSRFSVISDATSFAEADSLLASKVEELIERGIGVGNVKVNGIIGNIDEASNLSVLTLKSNNINIDSNFIPTSFNENVSNKFVTIESEDTLSEAFNKVETNLSTIVNEIIDDELVISATLSKHNESCGFDENANYIKNEDLTYIKNAKNLTHADELLDYAISDLNTRLSNVSVALDESYSSITYNQVGEGDTRSDVSMQSNAVGDDLSKITMTLERNINLLANEINDNEYVAAQAIVNLNTRTQELENKVAAIEEQIASILTRLTALEA